MRNNLISAVRADMTGMDYICLKGDNGYWSIASKDWKQCQFIPSMVLCYIRIKSYNNGKTESGMGE